MQNLLNIGRARVEGPHYNCVVVWQGIGARKGTRREVMIGGTERKAAQGGEKAVGGV